MNQHVVQPGECISSIARRYGLDPGALWSDPANRSLRERRSDPNVLYAGDEVVIPERERKSVSAETGRRHRFRARGCTETLRLRLLDELGEPRAGVEYVIRIDGRARRGTTDDDGALEEKIRPDAREAVLVVGDDEEEISLDLGHLDPTDEAKGIQQRLANLGFDCGPADGVLGPRTREALREFQVEEDIPPTGELDDETRELLDESYAA